MASDFGKKGGAGPTRGRKAETIEAVFMPGVVGRKRVFFGQRWMTYVESEKHGALIQAWESEEVAKKHLDHVNGDEWPVQLIALGAVI